MVHFLRKQLQRKSLKVRNRLLFFLKKRLLLIKFLESEDNASNDEIAGSMYELCNYIIKAKVLRKLHFSLPQDFFDSSFNPDSSKAGSSKSTTTTIKQTTNGITNLLRFCF